MNTIQELREWIEEEKREMYRDIEEQLSRREQSISKTVVRVVLFHLNEKLDSLEKQEKEEKRLDAGQLTKISQQMAEDIE